MSGLTWSEQLELQRLWQLRALGVPMSGDDTLLLTALEERTMPTYHAHDLDAERLENRDCGTL